MAKKMFQTVKKAKVKKTPFNLSHEKKLSFKMGQLVPCLLEEVVPGDKFNINSETFLRFAPMIAPIMHRVDCYIHYFYVPNRILWSNWEKFITGDLDTTTPKIELADIRVNEGDLLDYLGIPAIEYHASNSTEINALPLRAYKSIYNEYYRDQNLVDEIDITADASYNNLLYRAWEKDYFTSCLPWAQKGDNVTLPVTVPPEYKDISLVKEEDGDAATGDPLRANAGDLQVHLGASSYENARIENLDDMTAEIDVNDLRTATRLQRWLERNARAGSRYIEHLLAHWGVISSDSRLQRPEYLGGGKTPVVISEVLNNTGSSALDALPQGNMAGHGLSVGNTNRCTKFCEEHGWIMGIISVIPKSAYYTGIHKKFSRFTNMDYYYPEFAQLGEQEVKLQELWTDSVGANNNDVFGYQSRYAEYKYGVSTVHGNFRGDFEHWHLARKISTKPSLNELFITAFPDNRIFAVQNSDDQLWCQIFHNITAVRPMPYYADPKL